MRLRLLVHKIELFRSKRVTLDVAALTIYEHLEALDLLRAYSVRDAWPENPPLSHFRYVILDMAEHHQITLFGRHYPSRSLRKIDFKPTGGLEPVMRRVPREFNTLTSSYGPADLRIDDVCLSKIDADQAAEMRAETLGYEKPEPPPRPVPWWRVQIMVRIGPRKRPKPKA